ncbi:MAG: hypothetical protein H7232_02705 [Aeromicrobium sp.]|nr:hypothetical protein [Burkholderiales bacterium]
MNDEAEVMGWVLFEVLLAFGLAIFIVWWTFPKKKKVNRPTKTRKESAPSKDG